MRVDNRSFLCKVDGMTTREDLIRATVQRNKALREQVEREIEEGDALFGAIDNPDATAATVTNGRVFDAEIERWQRDRDDSRFLCDDDRESWI